MIAVIRRSRPLYSDPVTDCMTGCINHRIEGSSAGFQTNYVIPFRVYRGYGSNSGAVVYIPPSEIRPDFNDLRVIDTFGRNLQFHIDAIGTNFVDIAVVLYEIPTTGTAVKFLYGAGNIPSGAVSSAIVYPIFFDHFASFDTGVWGTTNSPSVSASGSIMSFQGKNVYTGVWNKTSYGVNYAMRAYAKMDSASDGQGIGWEMTNAANNIDFKRKSTPAWVLLTSSSSSTTEAAISVDATSYHVIDIARLSTTSAVLTVDNTTSVTNTTNVPTGSIVSPAFTSWATGTYVYCDWCAIRPCVSPEPSHGWWGVSEDL